ncbi:polysaccharide biosynthesis/export family protein [Mucilaginibacter sp.]|uniref:polysaccharide biosynthesis/export family protein n=1 Tax=Mucilaginibacter sp. TaxID=1882438 RepID=UPI003D13994B
MRHIKYTYLILLVLLICTSCSKRQYQYLFQQKSSSTDTTAQKIASKQESYRIKPQDILQIRNLQNSKDIVDLNPPIGGANAIQTNTTQNQPEGHLVEDDGTVALTGLGRIPIAGLTRVEAQTLIEGLYHKILLKNPIIEVKITNLTVSLFGEVKSPGNYPLTRDRTTLVQILGTAGGITEQANETDIKIIRGTQKDPQVTVIDLSNIQAINDPKAILQSGDIVYVEKNKRAIRNDNFLNLSQLIQPALLLFNTALIILTFTRR